MPSTILAESSPLHSNNSVSMKLEVESQPLRQGRVRYGDLRQAAFWVLGDTLHLLRIRRWKDNYDATSKFERGHELPFFEAAHVDVIAEGVRETLEEIVPNSKELQVKGLVLVDDLNRADNCITLMEALESIHDFYQETNNSMSDGDTKPFFAHADSAQSLTLSTRSGGCHGWTVVSWPAEFGVTLVDAVHSNVRWLRSQDRHPTFSEFVIEHLAYCLLASGEQVESLSFANSGQFLGTVGFRPVSQTYPSLTDPGDGHVFGTTRKQRWMEGAIVHVEHLERPGNVPRSLIESYRIPAILDFARVRLHTAGSMPNTYFTGRALRDAAGSFDHSFIKVVNTTSAACSQAFALGAAECKIAMDDLATSQMMAYLTALSGHTIRKPHQYLSCAFNLNLPLVDDMRRDANGDVLPSQLITSPFEIAQVAIRVAIDGGFDKVTWDGASDSYPSKCIIDQLPFAQWLGIVHRAHECGLTTYASAGFKFSQIRSGVWAGLDGLGIGGAQILRHMDHNSGMHGPFTEENLDRIYDIRNAAAKHIRGRGVALLARLDRMFFEGSLTERVEELRHQLFELLASADEAGIEILLAHESLQEIQALNDDGQRPYTAWAQRLLRAYTSGQTVLLQRFATHHEWEVLMVQLALALDRFAPLPADEGCDGPMDARVAPQEIEDEVYDVHLGRIWTRLSCLKAQHLSGGCALSRHDNIIKLKTTPFSSNAASRRLSRRGRSSSSVCLSL